MKHFYRLVYWKRRLLGTGAGAGVVRRPSAARRRRPVRIPDGARASLVFAAIVGVVVALSALFGSLDGASDGPGGGTEGDYRYAHEVEQGWEDLPQECRDAFGSKAAYAEFHERVVERPEDADAPRTGVSLSCGDAS